MDIAVKRLLPEAILPTYGRPGDAGLDIYACEPMEFPPGKRAVVKTGIALAVPEGFVGLVWDRSGMAVKNGMHCLAGVIDCTYRGELGIVLINLSETYYTVKRGDRIAQLLIQPVVTAVVREVDVLDASVRGQDGFGSSGR